VDLLTNIVVQALLVVIFLLAVFVQMLNPGSLAAGIATAVALGLLIAAGHVDRHGKLVGGAGDLRWHAAHRARDLRDPRIRRAGRGGFAPAAGGIGGFVRARGHRPLPRHGRRTERSARGKAWRC
jgi:hypothetical protein